jgi:hypothetical protein
MKNVPGGKGAHDKGERTEIELCHVIIELSLLVEEN